jgi:transcriptional regulator with GAF, ATPase, and Fis domain
VDGGTILEMLDRLIRADLEPKKQLDVVLTLVLGAVRAERGFVVVRSGDGPPEALVARNVDAPLALPELEYSRTLVRRALDTGAPVVVDGAAIGGGVRTAVDVSERSILAVPIGDLAVVYVDRHHELGRFEPEAIDLVRALADRAKGLLAAALRLREVDAELSKTREALERSLSELRRKYDFAQIVGQSRPIHEMLKVIARAAPTREPVLLVGESGTGKELLARAIHFNSSRAARPLVSVNCASIPASLAESELFGHARGAFTGATGEMPGVFSSADGGTLFLDEIGELPLEVQGKLLRALQSGEVQRLGELGKVRTVDVRVVAATHRPLESLVESGRFRQDLFFRLAVIRVQVPPLRERLEDVPALVAHLGRRIAAEYGWSDLEVSEEVLDVLGRHSYPGNVRELENLLRRGAALAAAPEIELEHLPDALLDAGAAPLPEAPRTGRDLLRLRKAAAARAQEDVERRFVEDALRRSSGNVSLAARDAGLSRAFFYKMLERLAIDPERFK